RNQRTPTGHDTQRPARHRLWSRPTRFAARSSAAPHERAQGGPVSASQVATPDPPPTAVALPQASQVSACARVLSHTFVIEVLRRPVESTLHSSVGVVDQAVDAPAHVLTVPDR